jgi:HSP20 family protein
MAAMNSVNVLSDGVLQNRLRGTPVAHRSTCPLATKRRHTSDQRQVLEITTVALLKAKKGDRAMANPSKSKSGDGTQQKNGGHRGGQLAQLRPRHLFPSFAPWGQLRSEFDRMFDDFVQGLPATWGGEPSTGWGLDVQESADAVVIRADAPGFDADDFDIEVRDDNLVLCACQSEEKTKDEEGYQWQKREMYRSVPLPAGVDADKIDAQYRNGVLSIKLPKTEQMKSRKIQVKS